MKNLQYITALCLTACLLFIAGCADLSVDNLNAPDTERVLADPGDVKSLPAGAFVTWWQASTALQPWMALLTAGDQFSSSWGNFGMRTASWEPRRAYDNSLTSSEANVASDPWYDFYSSLATANDVVIQIQDGLEIDNPATTKMVETAAYLLQGLSLGQLGLLMDQGFLLTDVETRQVSAGEITATEVEIAPYTQLIATAVEKLQLAVTTANEAKALDAGITFPSNYINGYEMTMDEVSQLANSMAARFLVYQARSAAENAQTDWSRVLSFANNGLTYDFVPLGDGGLWFDYTKLYGNLSGWIRLDQRMVNMFDSNQPVPFPDNTSMLPPANSPDARLDAYYAYVESVPFNADRGYYHFSNYVRIRSEHTFANSAVGPMHFFIQIENDLIKAEAILRSGGSASAAADLINKTRVTNGALPALTGSESTAELLDAIYYERFAEIDYFGPGQGFFDRRRFDDLQTGTVNQLPIPARELNILNMEIYTFGGNSKDSQYNVWLLPEASGPQTLNIPGKRQ